MVSAHRGGRTKRSAQHTWTGACVRVCARARPPAPCTCISVDLSVGKQSLPTRLHTWPHLVSRVSCWLFFFSTYWSPQIIVCPGKQSWAPLTLISEGSVKPLGSIRRSPWAGQGKDCGPDLELACLNVASSSQFPVAIKTPCSPSLP